MKASELIAAIEEGKTLVWDHKKTHPEKYEFFKGDQYKDEYVLKLIPSESEYKFGVYAWGWGSAFKTSDESLLFVLNHPELFEIEDTKK